MSLSNKTGLLEGYLPYLAVAGLVLLVMHAPGIPPFRPAPGETTAAARPVPEPFDIDHRMTEVTSVPKISKARIRQALELILSIQDDPTLSTPDDGEIIQLARQYRSGQRLYRATGKVVIARNGPGKTSIGRMAFNCRGHEYAFNPNVQTSIPFLALSLYHEFRHGVQCTLGMKIPESEDERCRYEAPAYAAQVRFLIALHNKGIIPSQVSAQEGSDKGLLAQTLQAWRALSKGEDAFCRWYRRKLREGTPEGQLLAADPGDYSR